MKTMWISAVLLLMGIAVLASGCGVLYDHERAYSPTIHSVTIENSSALNYPASVGNTLTCRADISTRHGTADATAAFVIGSIARAVPMTSGVATLPITFDMIGPSVMTATCVVSARVRDSRTKSRQANNTIQVYPYQYRAQCGMPVQYPYNNCPTTSLGVYVGPGQVAVSLQRN